MSDTFDVIVIGAGPAGYVAAIRAAQLGLKTACIEKDNPGGTCLNIGCIPSKALLDSSEKYHLVKTKFANHGINVDQVELDLEKMMKRKETVVRQLTQGVGGLLKKNKVATYKGIGSFAEKKSDHHSIAVQSDEGETIIHGKNVIIATGSVPVELPPCPFDGDRVVSSTEALSFPEVPKHLVVIGGGVIGLELGSVWKRLGAKVTIVEFLDRIVPGMDHDTAKELHKSLAKQGLEFMLATECTGVKQNGDQTLISVKDRQSGETQEIECDRVLVATGRRAFSEGLRLDQTGVEVDERGKIVIDTQYRTNVSGIYAIGDIVAGPMLAHKAEEEGVAAAEIIAGQAGHVNYSAIPAVVYTWPELAGVGETEEALTARGVKFRIGKFPFLANGRAKAIDDTEGFVKIIADAETDRVLGVHICGPYAGDLIAEAVTVMEYGGSAEDIARTSHAHPSLAEVVKEAALNVDKRQIHL